MWRLRSKSDLTIFKEIAFEGWKTFSKRTRADVLVHSSTPSLKHLRHELGMGEDQQNTWGCALSSWRGLISLLNQCWEGNEASQALCPSGCVIRRKGRLPQLSSLSGGNTAAVSRGGLDCAEGPVKLESFTPFCKTSPQCMTASSSLFWYGTT